MSDQRVPNRDVNAAARVALAISLRLQKMPFDQIAKKCGYKDESGARKAVKREMHRVVAQGVDELRMEELQILDKLHGECWSLAMDKENKGRLFAFDRLLEISKDRRKLLGLDVKPEENENTNLVVIREVPAGLLVEADSAGGVK